MKIAVYSDIHDNQHNMRAALAKMKEVNIDSALFLGDFNAPFIVKELIKLGIKTHAIWGNNEGDKVNITKAILASEGLFTIAEKTYDTLELDGKRVCIIHHPDISEALAKSGEFDAVFYGHTHEKDFKMVNSCILANPGEISSQATGICSFIIWDTATNEVKFVEIANPINVNL